MVKKGDKFEKQGVVIKIEDIDVQKTELGFDILNIKYTVFDGMTPLSNGVVHLTSRTDIEKTFQTMLDDYITVIKRTRSLQMR